jgi:hypothetical protein
MPLETGILLACLVICVSSTLEVAVEAQAELGESVGLGGHYERRELDVFAGELAQQYFAL